MAPMVVFTFQHVGPGGLELRSSGLVAVPLSSETSCQPWIQILILMKCIYGHRLEKPEISDYRDTETVSEKCIL